MKMLIDIDESVYMELTHRQKIRITDMCKACAAIMKGTLIAVEPNCFVRNPTGNVINALNAKKGSDEK